MRGEQGRAKRARTSFNCEVYDSSDEEKLGEQNGDYDLKAVFQGADFTAMLSNLYRFCGYEEGGLVSENCRITEEDLKKSFLLHSLGRMAIFGGEVENSYRRMKRDRLIDDLSLTGEDDSIDVAELGIEVKNIEDILAVGRLLRRSQMREYMTMPFRRDIIVDTKVTVSARNSKTAAIVNERLVANCYGLARGTHPYMDTVDLGGNGDDYGSAYKDGRKLRAANAVSEVVAAASSAAKEIDNDDLQDATDKIVELRSVIEQRFRGQNGDVIIADSLKKVCMGEPLLNLGNDAELHNKIYALAYLLFKTEVYRSPAALISHIQALDLIINGEMTLEDAFVNHQMPMTMCGAIKAARKLNDFYNDEVEGVFYPFSNPYSYYRDDATYDGTLLLVKREAAIFDRFLTLHLGAERWAGIQDDLQGNYDTMMEELLGEIRNFGLSLSRKISGLERGEAREEVVTAAVVTKG